MNKQIYLAEIKSAYFLIFFEAPLKKFSSCAKPFFTWVVNLGVLTTRSYPNELYKS